MKIFFSILGAITPSVACGWFSLLGRNEKKGGKRRDHDGDRPMFLSTAAMRIVLSGTCLCTHRLYHVVHSSNERMKGLDRTNHSRDDDDENDEAKHKHEAKTRKFGTYRATKVGQAHGSRNASVSEHSGPRWALRV